VAHSRVVIVFISLPVFLQYLCRIQYTWSQQLYTTACEVGSFPCAVMKQSREWQRKKPTKLLDYDMHLQRKDGEKLSHLYCTNIFMRCTASWRLQRNCSPVTLPSKWSLQNLILKYAIFFHTNFQWLKYFRYKNVKMLNISEY
jgi:hypothetical protein